MGSNETNEKNQFAFLNIIVNASTSRFNWRLLVKKKQGVSMHDVSICTWSRAVFLFYLFHCGQQRQNDIFSAQYSII